MVLALNVGVYFCKLLPLHMNGNLPVGIGMHVFAMICDLIMRVQSCANEFDQRTRGGEDSFHLDPQGFSLEQPSFARVQRRQLHPLL
eukprot:UN2311